MIEDELISLIASLAGRPASDVILGMGDDAAVLEVPDNHVLVTCTDTMVAGVHFPAATPAGSVGFKSLAVNLSDLAAMGARPRWAQLSLTMPSADESWVRAFMAGFISLADRHSVILVGGDTCSGPLSITVQAMGVAQRGSLLTRGTARRGDLIAVSGQLGDAALALSLLERQQGVDPDLLRRLHEPEPRLRLGQALVGIASSCIDISDGLLLDLERLLKGSACGANVMLDDLPASGHLLELAAEKRWRMQLAGGDDYELCFTVPPQQRQRLRELADSLAIRISVTGEVTGSDTISCFDATGAVFEPEKPGFQHFENPDET